MRAVLSGRRYLRRRHEADFRLLGHSPNHRSRWKRERRAEQKRMGELGLIILEPNQRLDAAVW